MDGFEKKRIRKDSGQGFHDSPARKKELAEVAAAAAGEDQKKDDPFAAVIVVIMSSAQAETATAVISAA